MATQVLGSVVVQDITYTEKQLGTGLTVTYINGGTAGSEVVTVSGYAITIKIQSSTSTATQVLAAFNASLAAKAIATAAITGTGSNVQKTCVTATLAGGTAAVKATLNVGPMRLTAASTGTSANSYRFKFTAGGTAGSEGVTVSTNDISVQIEEGVSTLAQVIAAINGDGTANTMVVASSNGPSTADKMRVAMGAAFVALSGGTALAHATHTVQNLIFTAAANGTAGNGISVSYTTGATAGAEVVTEGTASVSVQIENGVSTATQIKAALDGAATLITTATTGTASTAQKTVNAVGLSGEVGAGASAYFVNATATALTASFVWFPFGFAATNMIINCDETSGAKGVVLSFDGVNSADTVLFAQTSSYVPMRASLGVWLKYVSAAPAYRLHAWR